MSKSELQEIFQKIKILMKKYESPLVPLTDNSLRYELTSKKEVEIWGRKRKDVYFAGLMIHKDFVGFYYMPVYAEPEMKKIFKPELLKLLKGKSCFHIKKLDPELSKQIKAVLKIGFDAYKERGWV